MTTATGLEINVATRLDGLRPATTCIVPYFEDDRLEDEPAIRRLGGPHLERAVTSGSIKSTRFATTHFFPGEVEPGIVLVGAGKRGDVAPLDLMRIFATGARLIVQRGAAEIAVLDRGALDPFVFGQAAAEGSILGSYNPGIKKTGQHGQLDERPGNLRSVTLISSRGDDVHRGARLGEIVGEAKNQARDLVNLPPNELTPSTFADRARALAHNNRLNVEILDEEELRRLGMGSLLGVAAGSDQPPAVIVLRYGDRSAATQLAVVGKGLTFDSGGLSLKTAEGMETMKGDMGGGAAVLAGMVAIARLGPEGIGVTGYVGATENMPGGAAMRPGDVLTALNGETIEVLNTDAEGRLVLADLLAYASQNGATHVVDLATLTGAAVVALGHAATLAAGRPAEWVNRVVRAAHDGLERAWPMPLYAEYRRAMDSEVADIKNTGGRAGGALNAAAFLDDFAASPSWAHLDIAGTSWAHDSKPYQPKGGTGEGVGTIVALARDLSGQTRG